VKLLVLGGTQFLGRATVEPALERGHEVTLFNRGRTNPDLFPEVERLRGDRALDPIPDGEWTAVIDTSGYVPAVVRRSAEALRNSVERYLFVSSVSVYAGFREGPTEASERARLAEGQPDNELSSSYENYGPLKAMCEDVVTEIYGEGALIVRPGLVVGPHDPTGRFTYWPHRVARGGEFVVPGPPEERVQFVDARDLGAWMVDLCEGRESGIFNATHPGLRWTDLVESCLRVTESDGQPVWIDGDWLAERGVGQWMELPLWLHEAESVGMMHADVSRALAAGLTFRPLDDTVQDTLELAGTTEDAGLEPERESELIEAWRQG
jgi:2'-hydroxyisoflavone reductase